MKRLLVVLAVLMLCAANVYALNTPTGLDATVTQTTITYTWTVLDSLNQANADSLVLIDPSDSTVIATMDSVSQTTLTLTGLIPGKQYIYAVAADSAAEAFGISTPDTSTTTALVFAMTAGTNNKTDIAITISAIEDTTGIDSLCVVNMADSELVKFYLTTNTTSATISGLSPYTAYSWYVADGVNGNIISNGDTVTTARVDIDRYGISRLLQQEYDDAREMRLATSNQDAGIDTTDFTISGTSDTDSTVIYQAAEYTGIDFYVDTEDSVVFTMYIYAGYAGFSDETYPIFSLRDSLQVTADGPNYMDVDFGNKTSQFYLKTQSYTDNAATVTARFRLNRDNR